MSKYSLLEKTHQTLIVIVLSLSTIALTAELLPEVKAKMIVIPALSLTIILCIFEIRRRLNFNR